jgi:uncharacterized protein
VEPEPGPACDIGQNPTLTPEQRRRFQDPATILRLLRESRTIAIVGLSTNPAKPSAIVGAYIQRAGYRIIPVTPRVGVILGEETVPDLAHLPVKADLAVVFRPGPQCLAVAEQAIAAGIPAIWFQLDIPAQAAAEHAATGGLTVVLNRCIRVEHGRYAGGAGVSGQD